MSWKDKLGQAHARIAVNAGNAADEVLTQYTPKIRQFLAETVGPVMVDAARDDEIMTACIKLAYQKVPPKVRWVVREKAFTRFCLKHRDKLLPGNPQDTSTSVLPDAGVKLGPPPLLTPTAALPVRAATQRNFGGGAGFLKDFLSGSLPSQNSSNARPQSSAQEKCVAAGSASSSRPAQPPPPIPQPAKPLRLPPAFLSDSLPSPMGARPLPGTQEQGAEPRDASSTRPLQGA